MVKIYFTCYWQENFLDVIKKNTPNNSGIWKNIYATNDIYDCDYIIVLDDLDKNLLQKGETHFKNIIKESQIIFFQRENTAFIKQRYKSWFIANILPNVNKKYTHENKFFYTFTTANFLNKTYDQLKNMKCPKKSKNISCIVSTKNINSNYAKRIQFIKNYSDKYPNSIDIFGKGWNTNLGNNFKGELGNYHRHDKNKKHSKLDGLYYYNYSICLENFPNEIGYTSEKITDVLLSWCMPIYWGSKYTNKYYPKDAFHLIDLDEENILEKVHNISQTPITQENIEAIKIARNLILDKYNIWEHIYQIILNQKNYENNYSF